MYKVDVQIRFRDTDAYGHVNNAVYYTYMEYARIELFKRYGLLKNLFNDIMIVIAHSQCKYIKPITLDDKLRISITIEKVGNSSFNMLYKFFNENKEFALGKTTLVCINNKTKRSTTIPLNLKKMIEDIRNE